MSRYGGVAVEAARPHVVQDDRSDDQQNERRDPIGQNRSWKLNWLNGWNRYSQGSRCTVVDSCFAVPGGPVWDPSGGGRRRRVCHGPRGILRADRDGAGRPSPCPSCPAAATDGSARSTVGSGGTPGCEPCSPWRTETGSPSLRATSRSLDVEVFATDGTREHLAADGIDVALGLGPDERAAPRRRPGQDVPPRGLCGHPRPARRSGPARRARPSTASASSTSSSST